ncbi:pentatricopeptide repeat-containing protein At3g57430, chloroplastic isoform X1 [Selaginella moellendorffii]|uniref:pentatricopeptide repeat-containing protein At3g57430, chloroplastic isoform X1 n=2 Tax=Selaginella moellendorffii TaxID=88036 RepID=UPI000D1C895A|nr:pentatricopeptide repeat-containing protein At3g57430, chloroplastic isoform X1 [Selaginella moellendorffii]|eukprot:XP_024533076.1 pentatricopeptide repeat-containing protein At3g57430, chloroplastic isoform X1 [Selaginella moellendorffii]
MASRQLKLRLTHASTLLLPPRGKSLPPLDGGGRIGDDSVASTLARLDCEAAADVSHFSYIATYSSLLRRCANAGSLPEGRLVHDHIRHTGYASNIMLAELLIQMYGKCQRLDEARGVFDRMPRRSVYSWNLILAAYVENGLPGAALDLYKTMDLEPDRFTFSTILGACGGIGALEEGKRIHSQMNARNELVPDTVSSNSLITMYAKCGSIEEAKAVFDGTAEKSLVSWNCMIAAYAQQGHCWEAIEVYNQMESQGVARSVITYSSVLGACASLGREALETGKIVHRHLLASKLSHNVIVDTALLSMYGNCGSLRDAEEIFAGMERRNVVSWTVMVSIYIQHGKNKEALGLLMKMDLEGLQPNACTFSSVLTACANLGSLEMGKAVHRRAAASGLVSDTVQNALINMYAKCQRLGEAKRLFDQIPVKSDVSWNAIIAAYVQHGRNKEAFDVYQSRELQGLGPNDFIFASILGACSSVEEVRRIHEQIAVSEFRSDAVINNSLIKMYAKLGSVELARKAFEEMAVKDEASWNGIIIAYAQYGDDVTEALVIYERMKSAGVQGNAITFTNVLTACLVSGSLEAGRRIYRDLCKHELEKTDAIVGTVLVNMFARFGDLVTARHVFENNQQRNVISWNGMVMAYSQNGYYNEAVDVFHRLFLEGIQGDNISFTCIFHALSHAGSLDRGRDYFLSMGPDHGLTPTLDLYVSLVDLLGRSGRLNDAIALILDMPAEPDVMSWMTLLGGCKLQGNVELGKYAAERIFELDPEDPSPYVLLSNIYFAAGVERDAESLREVIASRFREEEYAATVG